VIGEVGSGFPELLVLWQNHDLVDHGSRTATRKEKGARDLKWRTVAEDEEYLRLKEDHRRRNR
jgi:hypothetical protein